MRASLLFSASLIVSVGFAQITWTACTLPVPTLTLLALGPTGELVTIQGTNPAQVLVSTDHGDSWENHAGSGGPNGSFLSDARIHVTQEGTILIWGTVGGAYQMWRSADGGDNFTSIASAQGVPGARFFMGFNSGPNGDVYMYGEGVIRSTDDGQTWTSIVGSTTQVFSLVATIGHLHGGYAGDMYRGALDGTDFAIVNTGGASVDPCSDLGRAMNERIIAVGGTDKVITSTDDGGSWNAVSSGIDVDELAHVAGTLFSDTWVCARQNNVYGTTNAGLSWSPAPPPDPIPGNEPVLDVLCDSTGTFYIYGYSYLYRSTVTTEVPARERPQAGAAHPNPCSGSFTVGADFANRTCQVLDPSGRQVLETRVDADGTIQLDALPTGKYAVAVIGTNARWNVVIQH